MESDVGVISDFSYHLNSSSFLWNIPPKSGEGRRDYSLDCSWTSSKLFQVFIRPSATFQQNSWNKSLPRRLMLRNCDLCQMLEGGGGWGSLDSNHFISFHVVKLLLGPPFQKENKSRNQTCNLLGQALSPKLENGTSFRDWVGVRKSDHTCGLYIRFININKGV